MLKLLFAMIGAMLAAAASAEPMLVVLTPGPTVTRLDPARDYVLQCPPELKVGATIILGGHDITLKGCAITIPAVRPRDDMFSRAIYVKDATGSVLIEDVRITNPFSQQFDGVYLAAPAADVTLRNFRIEGLIGRHAEFHSDAVQLAGVRSLHIDGMTIVGGYQMLNLGTVDGPNGEVWLNRVNGRFVGHQIFGKDDPRRGDNGGTFIWLAQGESGCTPSAARVHLTDVYVRQYRERGPGGAGWPNDRKAGCPAQVAADRRSVTWPNLPVEGKVSLRNPPGGDFVPAASAGYSLKVQ